MTEPTPRIMQSEARIRFQDCDAYGHLNNSRYIDYFLNARTDQLHAYHDIDIYAEVQKDGSAWVAAQNQIAYLEPAVVSEMVMITTRTIFYDHKSLRVEFVMYRADGSRCKALMWSDFIFYDLREKRVRQHEAKHEELFERMFAPVDEATFHERVLAFRARQRGEL